MIIAKLSIFCEILAIRQLQKYFEAVNADNAENNAENADEADFSYLAGGQHLEVLGVGISTEL